MGVLSNSVQGISFINENSLPRGRAENGLTSNPLVWII